jgi:hypothetical protein
MLQYGKQVIDLAIEIYDRIESKFLGTKDAGAKKAANFERAFTSEVKASPAITGMTESKALLNVDKIREGIWKTRPENQGKEAKTIMGKQPPPLGTKSGSGGMY